MGLSWNSWYNPLDNIAAGAKTIGSAVTPSFGVAPAGTSGSINVVTKPSTSTVFKAAAPVATAPAQDTAGLPVDYGSGDSGAYDGTYYGTGGGGSYSSPTPVIDYAAIAQFDQGIGNVQSGIDRLPGQLDIGNRNIDTAYTTHLNQLLQGKQDTQNQYNQNTAQNTGNYVTSKNTIGSNAGSSLNSLQRLLGARGAGGSSAYLFNAPQTVAHQAAVQRNGVGQTFAQNAQGLDTAWNNYNRDWTNSNNDLTRQRDDNKHQLQARVDTTRANLLQSLATLMGQKAQVSGGNPVTAAQPYLDQANSYLSSADQLGLNTPVLQAAPVNYQAPSLASYTTNPFAAPTTGQSAAGDYTTPFLSMLLGKNRDQNLTSQLGF